MRRLLLALIALVAAAVPAPDTHAMWGQEAFLLSGKAPPPPPPPPGTCGTVPTQAQNAGFTTSAFCADFSQASYATQSSWLDCNDSNDSLIWHSGTPGLSHSGQVACDINQVTDASIGKAVMHFRYLPTYGCQGCFNPMGMETKNEADGHINFSAVNMYVEVTQRILAANSDSGSVGTNEQLDGANSLYTWNNGSSGGSYEVDVAELYADRNGYSDAGINNHGVAGGGFLFTSYSPGNTHVPSGYSVTVYHRYGALITSDGSTHTYVCSFIDDVLQLCKDLNISGGDTSMYHTAQWLVAGMENHTILPSVQYDLYMQNIKVWTCAALSPCNGSTLFNSGGLTYWQSAASSTCQLGNHGLVRGRPRVLNGTLVADDACLLRGTSEGSTDQPACAGPASAQYYSNMHNTFHFNVIRVGIWLTAVQGGGCSNPGLTVSQAEAWLDGALSNASAAGEYMMVDFHNSTTTNTCPLWSDDTTFWNAIAPRYANNTNVIYEIQNEPDFCSSETYSDVASHEDSLYKLIRSAAPNTPIVAWSFFNTDSPLGAGLSNIFPAAPDISYSNTSIGFHGYSSGSITNFVNQARSTGAVIMTEYGSCQSNLNSNWAPTIQNLESLGVSWIGGCALPPTGSDPNLNVFWPQD